MCVSSTCASGCPARCSSTAAMCGACPTPASINVATAPGRRYVLVPVGPVQRDGLPAGISSTSEIVFQPRVHKVALGEPAREVAAGTGKPASGSLDGDVVADGGREDRPQESRRLGRSDDAERAQVVALPREAAV